MFRTSWGSHPPNHELRLRVFFTKALQHNEVQTIRIHAQSECKATTWTTPEGQIIDSKGPPIGEGYVGNPPGE